MKQYQGSAATQVQKRKRRDISEQLLTSTARICHKIERIWSGQPIAIGQSNSDNIDENGISLSICKSLQRDIKQIMETQSSKDYLSSLALLLQHDIDQYKQLLPNDDIFDKIEENNDKENDTTTPVEPVNPTTKHVDGITEKLDWIEQQQKERLKRVLEMEYDTVDLEANMEALETQLEQEIKARFSDPEVQEAFS
jgi:hypothetical protein